MNPDNPSLRSEEQSNLIKQLIDENHLLKIKLKLSQEENLRTYDGLTTRHDEYKQKLAENEQIISALSCNLEIAVSALEKIWNISGIYLGLLRRQ